MSVLSRAWSSPRGLFAGGTHGNELLTATAGAVLIVLLAALGVTILRLRPLLSMHLFVGMVLIGPLALKLASAGYRFARYYAGDPAYRSDGPPATPLRAIAPAVVLCTLVVFASGVALLLAGPGSRDSLLPIHKIAFIVWVPFTSLHVLGHLPTLAHGLRTDYGSEPPGERVRGRDGRALALLGALVLGLLVAIVFIPEFGPWLHSAQLHDH